MKNYELTFIHDWIHGGVPLRKGDKMIVREVSMRGDVINLINDNIAVITKIID